MLERYVLITVTDNNFLIRSEWGTPEQAIKAFHSLAAALWADTGFTSGYIAILDNQLDVYEGYKERIEHEVVAPAEVPEENTAE